MEIEHGEGTKWQMKGILVFVFIVQRSKQCSNILNFKAWYDYFNKEFLFKHKNKYKKNNIFTLLIASIY